MQTHTYIFSFLKNNKTVFEKCFEEIIVIKNYKVCNVSFWQRERFQIPNGDMIRFDGVFGLFKLTPRCTLRLTPSFC